MKKILLLLVGIGMILTSCSTSGDVAPVKVEPDFRVRSYKAITEDNTAIIIKSREPLHQVWIYTVGDTVTINANGLIGLTGKRVVIKHYLL